MKETNQFDREFKIQTSSVAQEIVFFSEEDISKKIGADEWVMPCGHNCCTCDSECK